MNTTAQIRTALAAALSAEFSSDWNISPYLLASPNPPQIEIVSGPVDYDLAMGRGLDLIRYIVRALVQHGSDLSGQVNLDSLLDGSSASGMKAVLEADKTLGGVVEDLRVTEASELKVYPQGDFIGIEWIVELYP